MNALLVLSLHHVGLFKRLCFLMCVPPWIPARGGWEAEACAQTSGDCAKLKDAVKHAVQCANYSCLSSICFHLGSIRKVGQWTQRGSNKSCPRVSCTSSWLQAGAAGDVGETRTPFALPLIWWTLNQTAGFALHGHSAFWPESWVC